MSGLLHSGEAVDCPVCDGPCTEPFERSEHRFPDALPVAVDGSRDPAPVKAKKPNRRGKRRLIEDRMVRPSEDR